MSATTDYSIVMAIRQRDKVAVYFHVMHTPPKDALNALTALNKDIRTVEGVEPPNIFMGDLNIQDFHHDTGFVNFLRGNKYAIVPLKTELTWQQSTRNPNPIRTYT